MPSRLPTHCLNVGLLFLPTELLTLNGRSQHNIDINSVFTHGIIDPTNAGRFPHVRYGRPNSVSTHGTLRTIWVY